MQDLPRDTDCQGPIGFRRYLTVLSAEYLPQPVSSIFDLHRSHTLEKIFILLIHDLGII